VGEQRVEVGHRGRAGEDVHPRGRPRRREPVVHRAALSGGPAIGLLHRERPGLQLEGRGDAIQRLQPLAGDVLAVAVQVDEAGAHDQPGHVDGDGPGEMRADLAYGATGDPDVADGVEPRLGIDHPTPTEHEGMRAKIHEAWPTVRRPVRNGIPRLALRRRTHSTRDE
jgi:hypothetical protein